MADNTNIIKSKVVGSEFDVFWTQDLITDELQKNTLVLSCPYLPGSTEEQQLLKMLQACTLTPDNYHIIQVAADQQVPWHQLRDRAQPQHVILLGITPQQLGISAWFRLHEPNRFNDCIWIPAVSLPELDKHPDAKKALWLNALKPVFVDKQYEINR